MLHENQDCLDFKKLTVDHADIIRRFAYKQPYRSCDYTIGGLILWADYYKYEYAIACETLYIRGIAENGRRAFSIPLGDLPLTESIKILKSHCRKSGEELYLSFVPNDALEALCPGDCQYEFLQGWSDYVYLKEKLCTLSGNELHKKRNRLNKFHRENPNAEFHLINDWNIVEVMAMIEDYYSDSSVTERHYLYEKELINNSLQYFSQLQFYGGFIKIDGIIEAITIGEVIKDTLFVHTEKAFRDYNGIYEAINNLFAKSFGDDIIYINREEDLNIPGLRRAKQVYCPQFMIDKYNLCLKH